MAVALFAGALLALAGVPASLVVLVALAVLEAVLFAVAWLPFRLLGERGARARAALHSWIDGAEDDDNPPQLGYRLIASLVVAELVAVYFGAGPFAPAAARAVAAAAAALGAALGARRVLAIAGPGFTLLFVAVPAAAGSLLGALVGMALGYALSGAR